MPLPDKTLKYYEKNLLDHVIDQVASKDGDLNSADLNKVYIAAQIQSGIDKYLAEAKNMTEDQLESEVHNSARLGRHLEAVGKKRPPRSHAHAIVAGKNSYAAMVRALMARLAIRIDDPDNGCWLPENTAATPHPQMPKAIPHSRIHRFNYYFWLRSRLVHIQHESLFRKDLQLIARHLQERTFPEFVMLKKGQGLPNSGYLA